MRSIIRVYKFTYSVSKLAQKNLQRDFISYPEIILYPEMISYPDIKSEINISARSRMLISRFPHVYGVTMTHNEKAAKYAKTNPINVS